MTNKELVKKFNLEKPITKKINDFLIEANKLEKDKHTKGKIYPSSVHKCSRELCYELISTIEVEFEPRILKIFDNGNGVHERIQKYLKDVGFLICDESPIVNEDLKISGRMDALLKLEGYFAIGEIKSSGDRPFTKMKEANSPDPKYVAQTQLYMHLSGIDLGVIYIENKNTQEVLEFWIEYDKEYCTNLIKKLKTVLKYTDEGKIISREMAETLDLFMADSKKMYKNKYTQTCYYCRYCDYREECYKK